MKQFELIKFSTQFHYIVHTTETCCHIDKQQKYLKVKMAIGVGIPKMENLNKKVTLTEARRKASSYTRAVQRQTNNRIWPEGLMAERQVLSMTHC